MGRTSAKPDSRHRSGGAAHRTRSVSLQPSATLPAASAATAAGQPERSCLGPHRDAVCVAKSDGGRGGLLFALRNLSWPGRPAKARTPCAPCCWLTADSNALTSAGEGASGCQGFVLPCSPCRAYTPRRTALAQGATGLQARPCRRPCFAPSAQPERSAGGDGHRPGRRPARQQNPYKAGGEGTSTP